jgi:hypothetical protein
MLVGITVANLLLVVIFPSSFKIGEALFTMITNGLTCFL